ncbi:MAG: cobaltochelatase subunit CobN, partial [Tardiphaga sp.]|uniref:cobaltochelatase subunit CobN n=1 Tax=Tardiphaga sp. TaxID=1926292 RepID=UPI00198FA541
MQKRITPVLETPVRVVIVTMDSHLSGAAARASKVLQREFPGLDLAVHAADEWGSNDAALARCHADIARGDIVIATMLFLDDHVRAVMPALAARRDGCDAMIGCMSASEVVKLSRVGKFDMSGESMGAIGWLKKLRGKRDGKPAGGKGEMAMLRRLPKILRFIPGTAQDMRAYFLTLQYWLAGSEQNIANMVRLLVDRYADGPRRALRGIAKPAAPVDYADIGVYHPRMAARISDSADQLPELAQARGTVGVLMLRSYLLAGNSGHYDGVIAAFEAKGLRVIPAFASGLDQRPAIERFFMKDGRSRVDAVVSLTGFSLVGGPAYNDAKAAEDILATLDVPYLSAHPVEFQTLEQWGASDRGLMPVESTIMVAIPELDGAAGPMVYGGRSDGAGAPCTGCEKHCVFERAAIGGNMHVCAERAQMLASRTLRLVELRRAARAERKVAIVLFNFPPNAGNTGTAAFLSVFESLQRTLQAMAREGYQVEVPASVDELRERIVSGNAGRFGADANVHARIAASDHVTREKYLRDIEAQWGPAPGRQQSDGSSIFVLG